MSEFRGNVPAMYGCKVSLPMVDGRKIKPGLLFILLLKLVHKVRRILHKKGSLPHGHQYFFKCPCVSKHMYTLHGLGLWFDWFGLQLTWAPLRACAGTLILQHEMISEPASLEPGCGDSIIGCSSSHRSAWTNGEVHALVPNTYQTGTFGSRIVTSGDVGAAVL